MAELLVPFKSSWRPLAVASGVVSFYLLVAVEMTSLAMRRIPRAWWRGIHRTSFVLWLMATVHMLQAGADVDNALLRVATLAATNIIAFLTVVVVASGSAEPIGRLDLGTEAVEIGDRRRMIPHLHLRQ